MIRFKIPLVSEISAYIRLKKGWPKEFCDYYAERFWNYYQSCGWKLSNGNPMKDWQAAFNSQWQNLKFKEDIDKWNSCNKVEIKSSDSEIDKLNLFLDQYIKHPTFIGFSEFGKFYEFMKSNNLMKKFTKEEVDNIKSIYQDNYKCRCACVQITFDHYAFNGKIFKIG